MYLISYNFQRLGTNRGLIKLKKQSQYNKSSFYSLIRPQNTKNQCWIQKIDGITLKTYGIVVSIFSMLNKDSRMKLFKKKLLIGQYQAGYSF